jgi:hypothetical protein
VRAPRRSRLPRSRCYAWDLRGAVAFAAGEYDLGNTWAERRFELLDELTDPDTRADIYSAPIARCIWSGRFKGGAPPRGHPRRADGAVHRTPPAARRRDARRGSRSCSERGTTSSRSPITRAIVRTNDLGRAEELLARSAGDRGWFWGWISLSTLVTRLDALAAIRDRAAVEAEATELLRPNTYIEPFALRALGTVRDDEELIERARARFAAFGLTWHAERTARAGERSGSSVARNA